MRRCGLQRANIAEEQARLEKVRGEADYLRHAHEELTKLAPEPGEEATLAERRTAMMQAEKVSAELRDAYEAVAGDSAPLAAFSSVLRRLERRQAQAPELIIPAVQALDAAVNAFDMAGQSLDQALRLADYDQAELERVEERLFALRAAGRKYRVAIDALGGARRTDRQRSRRTRCGRGAARAA